MKKQLKYSYYHDGYAARIKSAKFIVPANLTGIYVAQFTRGFKSADKAIKAGQKHEHIEMNPKKRVSTYKSKVKARVKNDAKKPVIKFSIRRSNPRIMDAAQSYSLATYIYKYAQKLGKLSPVVIDNAIDEWMQKQ